MPRPATALLSIVLTACGGRGASAADPGDTLRAFIDASRRGDLEAVHAMLDEATRAELSAEDLRAAYDDSRAEVNAQLDALSRADAPPEAQASIELSSGSRVFLILEDGGYRLTSGILDFVAPTTPEGAVAALRHALLRKSLPALLRVLSRSTRAELEAQIVALLESSEDELDLEIAEDGDQATVRLEGFRIDLIREAGEWRVHDIR